MNHPATVNDVAFFACMLAVYIALVAIIVLTVMLEAVENLKNKDKDKP